MALDVRVKKEERERESKRRNNKMGQRKGRDYLIVLSKRGRTEKRKD